MAAPRAAEHEIKACQVCDKPFDPKDVRIPTYRQGRFWFECLECFERLGGVTWVGPTPKYKRLDR